MVYRCKRPDELKHLPEEADFYMLTDIEGNIYAIAALLTFPDEAPGMLELHLIVMNNRKAYKYFEHDLQWMITYCRITGYKYVYGLPGELSGRERKKFEKFAAHFGFTETATLRGKDAVVLPVGG
jgi:hypothetical protein